ncbi:MAG: transcriptional regulator [Acidobacteria bacterium]|nr:transcriptional regulator [Acidobacteriota bacterium]
MQLADSLIRELAFSILPEVKLLRRITFWMLSLIFLVQPSGNAAQADWAPIGPFGGDVRSLAADPRDPDRMFLGTRTGQIYLSTDGGKQWNRLTGLQAPADWVVDDLLVDPTDSRILYAGMWSVLDNMGGIFKSTDGGSSWQLLEGLSGQFVRALALSPSNPKILVAGTREGVFRSEDAGLHWRRISPPGHPEIRNLESVALDPLHPEIIYVGTWHLPWKTADGGAAWVSIKKGMIDDSDVFSVIVDPSNRRTLYATACTGIYRSDSAGTEWRKIQGIPTSARRTHTLVLDPSDPRVLYAGTTEGLWRTKDGGQSWQLLTSSAWIINAVVIDPRNTNHIYLGMDHAGVMESRDGGKTFQPANTGFAQRQISRIVADPNKNGHFYVALLHDRQFGGVYRTENYGASWQQLSDGLEGRDVLSLVAVNRPVWKLLAGTMEGVFEYSAERPRWQNKSRWEVGINKILKPTDPVIVRDLYQRDPAEPTYAATSAGLFASADGELWKRLPIHTDTGGFYTVRIAGEGGKTILAATSAALEISSDGGQNWNRLKLEENGRVQVLSIAVHPKRPGVIFVGTKTGLFRSADGGRLWEKFGRGVPFAPISEVAIAPDNPLHIFVANSLGVFQSFDGGNGYQRLEEGLDGLLVQRIAIPVSKEGSGLLISSAHNGIFFNSNWFLLTHLQAPSQ